MVVSALAVHVAVRDFLLCGLAYLNHLDMETQRLARERVVGIDVRIELAYLSTRTWRMPWLVCTPAIIPGSSLPAYTRFFSGMRITAVSSRSP